jgi:hypothetical protein
MDSRSCIRNDGERAASVLSERVARAAERGVGRRVGSLVAAAALAIAGPAPRTLAEPVRNEVNGHYYEAIERPGGLTWAAANRAAAQRVYLGRPGHLATITSPEENLFVTTYFRPATQLGYWLGGFQLPGILDPAAGWQWVTGEPFSYTNWLRFDFPQPDDAFRPGTSVGDENALQFFPSAHGQWNDALPTASDLALGYLVEYSLRRSSGDPAITGFTPADRATEPLTGGPPGALVRLAGSNLGESGTVMFDRIPWPAAVVSWSPTEVLLYVPAAPTYPFKTSMSLVIAGKNVEGGAFTIATPAPERDNLLANGSFEYPDSRGSPVPWGYTYGVAIIPDPALYRGASIPGWRIPRGTIEVDQRWWQPAPGQGRQSIDLTGDPGAARIEQTFSTERGRRYLLSGWISHNPLAPFGRGTVSLNGSVVHTLSHTLHSTNAAMNWIRFTYRFLADDEQTTLAIQDTTGYWLVHGLALDGLSVTLAVE